MSANEKNPTMAEILHARKEAEKKIMAAITEFKNITGIDVSDIRCETVSMLILGDSRYRDIIVGVSCKVEL